MSVRARPSPIHWALLCTAFVPLIGACEFRCNLGRSVEKAVYGPVLTEPTLGEIDPPIEADAVQTDSPAFYIIWSHPDLKVGDTVTLHIFAESLPGVPENQEIGTVPTPIEEEADHGYFVIPSQEGGFLAGRYRAEVRRGDELVGAVDFEISAAESTP
jgi:hypothetical protein